MKLIKMKFIVLTLLSIMIFFLSIGAVSAAEPKFGGVLRVMADADISSLDPHKIGWQNHEVLRQIFEGLLAVDEGFKVIPGLAKSWTVSDDGLTYTFTLRKGVYFHNGKEMTAADIKATYERLLQSSIKQKFETISKIDTPDAHTVVMTLSQPTATFLINVAQPHTIGIMPAEEASAEANQKNIQNPIGTGPFMFVEWIPDRHVKLKRFEKYWGGEGEATGSGGKKAAYVDEVIIRPIKERSVRVSSLEAGDIDLGFIPTTQKERLEKNPNLKIMGTGPTFDFWNFWFCVNDESPMKDINLRQAFAYAIDKEEMIIATTGGPGSVANSAFPSFSSWFSKYHSNDYGPKQDLEKAKAYLKKSAYNGETIIITTCKDYAAMDKQAVVAQAQLKNIGINTELEYLDWTSLFAKYKSGKFHIMSYGYGAHADPDMYYFARLHSKHTYNGWGNSKFDALVTAARSTTDFDKRKALYDQAQQILVDELPLLVTFTEEYFYGANKRVQGFKPWGAAFLRLWNIWLDD